MADATEGQLLQVSASTIVGVTASPGGYSDEEAQDAVGAMVETASLVYADATPLLSVKRQMSVTADTNGIKLDGDAAEPGVNQVYGTNGAGAKGWKADPSIPAGSTPPWHGKIIGCMGDGNPNDMLRMMRANPIHATPTNISITVARCSFFRPAANITVNSIRFFGVGATTGVYHVAIYRYSDLARLTVDLSPNTAAQAWATAATGLNLTLTAGVLYFIAVSVDTTGTTAGMHCIGATTGRIGVLPQSWPGNLDVDLATPIVEPVGLFQFAVSTGALPNPAATLVAQAAWTGGMPAIFLDNA